MGDVNQIDDSTININSNSWSLAHSFCPKMTCSGRRFQPRVAAPSMTHGISVARLGLRLLAWHSTLHPLEHNCY